MYIVFDRVLTLLTILPVIVIVIVFPRYFFFFYLSLLFGVQMNLFVLLFWSMFLLWVVGMTFLKFDQDLCWVLVFVLLVLAYLLEILPLRVIRRGYFVEVFFEGLFFLAGLRLVFYLEFFALQAAFRCFGYTKICCCMCWFCSIWGKQKGD